MPRAAAHALVGGEATSIPRPFGASGAATTSSGTNPARSSSSNMPTAIRDVPKTANRIFGFRKPEPLPTLSRSLFAFLFVIDFVCLVRVQNASQVVHLMLKDVCEKAGGAACEAAAVLIVSANRRFLRARHCAPLAADGETSFVFLFLTARHLEQFGVDVY